MSQLDNFDVVFDPVLGRARAEGKRPETVVGGGTSSSSGGGTVIGGGTIPQYDADPGSPNAEDAWVLHSTSGGAGGGELKFIAGLMTPITSVGAVSHTYQLSYRTQEGTTKRVTLT